VVDSLPPLPGQQRELLALIFRGHREGSGRAARLPDSGLARLAAAAHSGMSFGVMASAGEVFGVVAPEQAEVWLVRLRQQPGLTPPR
jgi:hypothetical protein